MATFDSGAELAKAFCQVDELAMLVVKLAYALQKSNPSSDLPRRALDYLHRHKLQGSPLRGDLTDKSDCCKTRFAQEDVFDAICEERRLQDEKWGSLEDKQQSVAGYLLILESELEEAKAGWMKNKTGRHSALSEILQIASVAVACLQQYGTEGNPL